MEKTQNISLKNFIKASSTDYGELQTLMAEREGILTFDLPLTKKKLHVITSPAYISQVFLKNKEKYSKSIAYGPIAETFSEDVKVWAEYFNKNRIIKFVPNIVKSLKEKMSSWKKFSDTNQSINLQSVVLPLTFEVFMESFFPGARIDSEKLTNIFRELLYLSTPKMQRYIQIGGISLPFTPPYYRYKKVFKDIIAMGGEVVNQSLQDNISDESFAKYFAISQNYPPSVEKLTKKQREHLNQICAITIFSGAYPLFNFLMQMLVSLSLYPGIANKIYEEVHSVLKSEDPTYEKVQELKYTSAVIQELLRLYPPSMTLFRVCESKDTIGDQPINVGDFINIPVSVCLKLSKYWFNPEGFNPDRFLEPLTDDQKLLFVAFGIGEHYCKGQSYTMVLFLSFLSIYIRQYRFNLSPGTDIDYDHEIIFHLQQLKSNIEMKLYSYEGVK